MTKDEQRWLGRALLAATEPAEQSFTLEEIEALLTAERERCAAEVLRLFGEASPWLGKMPETVAAAIRSLAPQTIGGEE